MEYQSYVIFELSRIRYGIQTTAVQEFFFLPEVSPIAEAHPEVVGVINLRGEILPIMDLNRRLARQSHLYQVNDIIVVTVWQGQRVGIVVNQVYGLQTIMPDQITAHLRYTQPSGQPLGTLDGLVMGLARVEETIITLLSPESLVQGVTSKLRTDSKVELNYGVDGAEDQCISNHTPPFIPSNLISQRGVYDHLDIQEQHILRERTDSLRRSFDSQDALNTFPVVVVELEQEYFGFSLETVYEFTIIQTITPIPCCPPHIIGNINLRGEIITIVDIREAINLSASVARSQRKAIIVRMDQLIVGIAVDNIFDVIYIHPSQVVMASASMHSFSNEYVQEIVPYKNTMMSMINLYKLLTSNALLVNQEV